MKPNYKEAIQHLRQGGVILYPSDTVWGIGCDATNAAAIERINKIKQSPENKALIVLISQVGQLTQYVEKVPDIAWDLVEFAEKPLTVIYPKGKNVAPNLLGADGTIAIRLVKDEVCQGLVYTFGKALVSTSANISGQATPTTFAKISEEIKQAVDYILQPVEAEKPSSPSTIIKLGLDGTIEFIRK